MEMMRERKCGRVDEGRKQKEEEVGHGTDVGQQSDKKKAADEGNEREKKSRSQEAKDKRQRTGDKKTKAREESKRQEARHKTLTH